MSIAAAVEPTTRQPATGQSGSAHPAAHLPAEVLSFRLGAEEYGIDILKVQEIRGYERPTRIANAPDFMKGVVNLRGVIVPVVDMRLHLGLTHAAYDAATVVIILNVAKRTVGMVVDSVSGVLELHAHQVQPAPVVNGVLNASHILGLGTVTSTDGQRMLILVDIERLMRSEQMGLVDDPAA